MLIRGVMRPELQVNKQKETPFYYFLKQYISKKKITFHSSLFSHSFNQKVFFFTFFDEYVILFQQTIYVNNEFGINYFCLIN